MYTDEELTKLEEDELEDTELSIALMLAILAYTKDDLEKELRSFYTKYGKDGVVTYAEARKWISNKNRKRRLNTLLLFISTRFGKTLSELEIEFDKMVELIIEKENKFFKSDVDSTDISLKWGSDNKDWSERLEEDVELWEFKIESKIKQNILKRKSLDDTLEDLYNLFDNMSNVLETLGETESSAINSIARHEILKELGCSKYRFYTQPDERRCEVCGSMHGLTFPMSAYEVGVTASPLHPHCRCWEVPIRD